MGPLVSVRRLITRRLGRAGERRPSAGIGAASEAVSDTQAAWKRSSRRADGQVEMRENPGDHRRVNDCGDDLQGAAAAWAVFDVDIEDTLEQARPTHARGRMVRVGIIGGGIACLLRWTGNDCSTRLGVRDEYTVEADQMQARAGNERGQSLHKLQRREHDVGGAVLIRALELQHHLASVVAFDPLIGERRAGNVAAQAFELLALIDAAAHRCGVWTLLSP